MSQTDLDPHPTNPCSTDTCTTDANGDSTHPHCVWTNAYALLHAGARAFTNPGPLEFCQDVTEIPVVECEALLLLFTNTIGENWTNNDGWLTTLTPCDWYGVTCRNGRVEMLKLNENGLEGTIPPQLANLAKLKSLFLYGNQLTGPIPPELGLLDELQILRLDNNQLKGSIPPTLGNLANLRQLLLQSNNLSGPLPPELGNLANLQVLYLQDNQLSGSIPPALGNLANLQRLNLSGNNLSGELPEALANVSSGGFCAAAEGLAPKDCEALVALYESTGGADWANNDGWLISATPCEWYGVTCRNERVEMLKLNENGLGGNNPAATGQSHLPQILVPLRQ